MRATPMTDAGMRRYDQLHPVEAAVRAWREPGPMPGWHSAVKREVHRIAPLLGRALDRLARAQSDDRAAIATQATQSVAGSLQALYGRCEHDPDEGCAHLVDGLTDAERWRRATVIVDELIRTGLI